VVASLAICRFVHFLSAMLVFGASAYLRLYAPVELRRALSAKVKSLSIAASVVLLATACLWLSLEAASMVEDWRAAVDPDAIEAVLIDTAFGHAWMLHLALAAALAGAAVLAPRDSWTAVVILSGLLLASLGLVGHAAMQTGVVGFVHRANRAMHLLAAGAWIGGLLPFVLCLDAYARNTLRRNAVTAMMRFSYWGHFVVAAIVATGVANIALTSGHAPLPPSTPYRALLNVKIALVAVMIGLAVVNRYALVPRLKGSANALSALRAISLVNVVLGTIVVALVSVFALLDPG
jgi:putative copper resistance protein D